MLWQTLTGLLLLLYACGPGDSGKPVIAVSFESQKWLVEQIVGDDYEVVALLPPGSDPEMFDPDMRTMKALERAEAYLTTSTLGFETQVGERIKANYPDLKVIDLTEGIDIIMHTHGVAGASSHAPEDEAHGHHDHDAHPVGDPHILSSMYNASRIAKNICLGIIELRKEKGMSDRDYASGQDYFRNLADLQAGITRRENAIDSLLISSDVRGCSFIVMHPSLSYYARDYDMTQIPLETDGKEASPRQLEQRLAQAAASAPRALFYEAGHSEAQAREIAASLGIKAYPVKLNGPDFLDEIEHVTRALIE